MRRMAKLRRGPCAGSVDVSATRSRTGISSQEHPSSIHQSMGLRDPARLLSLQQTIGNRAVLQLLASQQAALPLQKKPATRRQPGAASGPIQRAEPEETKTGEGKTTVAVPTVIGYIGMNPAAAKEASVLKRVSKDRVLVSLDDPKAQKSLSTSEGIGIFIYRELGLNPITDAAQFISAFHILNAIGKAAREQVGHMMKWFALAEQGKHRLQRLVLSGHSDGVDLWGDSDADHEPGSFIIHRDLANIANAFPKAASQVQDIMFSACWSVMAIQRMVEIFPNISTVWGYIGFSPSIKQGSAQHIKKWEMTTRGSNTPKARDRRGVAAIWKKGEGYVAGSPADYDLQELKDSVNGWSGPEVGAMYRGEKEMDDEMLRNHYFDLQLISIHPDAEPKNVKSAREQLEIVLRLRYWNKIVTKFRTTHGETMKKGYAEAGMAHPPYMTYYKRDRLALHMSDMEAQLSKKPSDTLREFLDKQLRKGLWELDPMVIPDEWI